MFCNSYKRKLINFVLFFIVFISLPGHASQKDSFSSFNIIDDYLPQPPSSPSHQGVVHVEGSNLVNRSAGDMVLNTTTHLAYVVFKPLKEAVLFSIGTVTGGYLAYNFTPQGIEKFVALADFLGSKLIVDDPILTQLIHYGSAGFGALIVPGAMGFIGGQLATMGIRLVLYGSMVSIVYVSRALWNLVFPSLKPPKGYFLTPDPPQENDDFSERPHAQLAPVGLIHWAHIA